MRCPRSLLPLVLFLGAGSVLAQSVPKVEVFKNPSCGCCQKWVEHLGRNGFQVTTQEVGDVPAARRQIGMPDRLGSCHTARIGGYAVEGHVLAADIRGLLAERPKALGLAVPAMPPGAPGMEGPQSAAYETLLVQADGSTKVFARH